MTKANWEMAITLHSKRKATLAQLSAWFEVDQSILSFKLAIKKQRKKILRKSTDVLKGMNFSERCKYVQDVMREWFFNWSPIRLNNRSNTIFNLAPTKLAQQ